MDYFFIEGCPYFVTADCFRGWPCIYDFKGNHTPSNVLIDICRELFINYSVPEEISSDGGPQFTSSSFQIFMKNWGIKHRLSSAYYPQSNGHAESAVKTAKQIIRNNIDSKGNLNKDKAALAILQYCNTPLNDIGLSPAQILLH